MGSKCEPRMAGPARWRAQIFVGGDEEDRTPDLRIANATLSQLSYAPDPSGILSSGPSPTRPPAAPEWLNAQRNERALLPLPAFLGVVTLRKDRLLA